MAEEAKGPPPSPWWMPIVFVVVIIGILLFMAWRRGNLNLKKQGLLQEPTIAVPVHPAGTSTSNIGQPVPATN